MLGRQRVPGQDRRGNGRAELGADQGRVLAGRDRVAERVEPERDGEPPLVMVRALQQRDVIVTSLGERRAGRQWQHGAARDRVSLTNLDQPLFDGAGATKRDLVDYLDAVHQLLIGELRDRPLSVIRVLRGQAPFMQKNVPKYRPEWVPTVSVWAEASKREVSYALCNDRRTLLWFANQRAAVVA